MGLRERSQFRYMGRVEAEGHAEVAYTSLGHAGNEDLRRFLDGHATELSRLADDPDMARRFERAWAAYRPRGVRGQQCGG